MRNPLLTLLAVTLTIATRSTSQTTAPAAAQPVTITVNTGSAGLRIPSDFLGFSFETGSLTSASGFPAESPVFQLLASQVGPVSLRFGGNSSDKTGWRRGARTTASPATVLMSSDVDRVFAFARSTGSRVLFGLNLGSGTSSAAADEADYVQSTGADALLGFEIGNEPDLYTSNGLRPTAYSVTDYLSDWGAFAAAIQAQVPAAILTGPADAGNVPNWTQPFAARFGSRIVLLTQHLYPTGPVATVGANASNAATIPILLSAATRTRTDSEAAMLRQIAQAANVPWRMAETNSCYNGGQAGVSDAFASALWALDYMFTLAARGAVGVNFHGGGAGVYTPIAVSGGQFTARPLYYAMLMFRAAARGRMVPVSVAASGVNLTSYATLADDGTLRVTVVNKDAAQAAAISVSAGANYATAAALRLTASSLDATSGVTLGGAEAETDGSWSPSQIESLQGGNGVFATTVAAGSAVMLSFGNGSLSIASAAPGQSAIAPQGLGSAYGQNLGFVERSAPLSNPPRELSGVQLTIKDAAGVTRTAQLSYVSPSQVNFVTPEGVASGPATVSVGGTTGTVSVAAVAPGLFTMPGTQVAAAVAVRVSGGSQQPVAVFDCGSGTCRTAPIPIDSASTVYVSLYGTGIRGGVAGVSCTLGGITAPVQYAGAQGQYPGLDQVNITIPVQLQGAGEVDVVVNVDGLSSKAVRLNFGAGS